MAATQDAELLKQDDAVVEREIAARRHSAKLRPKLSTFAQPAGMRIPCR